jgi:hypothetical protein
MVEFDVWVSGRHAVRVRLVRNSGTLNRLQYKRRPALRRPPNRLHPYGETRVGRNFDEHVEATRPRSKSLSRGCEMPSRFAASACVAFQPSTTLRIAITICSADSSVDAIPIHQACPL